MKLASYTKTPVERKRYSFDYSSWLDTSETITAATFTVSQVTTNTPVTPLQVDAYSIASPATSVVFFVNYGDIGSKYSVDVKITTSGGQIKEDTILFTVRSA